MSNSQQEVSKKTLKTIHFGEIEVEDDKIFNFPEGLLGFEDYNNYVLLNHAETAPLKWLISVENPNIGFPLINPFLIDLNYKVGKKVDLENEAVFVVITLGNKDRQMTANMKAPLVLKIDNKSGRQIIVSSDKYTTKEPVLSKTPKEES